MFTVPEYSSDGGELSIHFAYRTVGNTYQYIDMATSEQLFIGSIFLFAEKMNVSSVCRLTLQHWTSHTLCTVGALCTYRVVHSDCLCVKFTIIYHPMIFMHIEQMIHDMYSEMSKPQDLCLCASAKSRDNYAIKLIYALLWLEWNISTWGFYSSRQICRHIVSSLSWLLCLIRHFTIGFFVWFSSLGWDGAFITLHAWYTRQGWHVENVACHV